MINWKTTMGLTLFIVSGIELLIIKDNVHKPSLFLTMMEGLFFITVVLMCVLIFLGLFRHENVWNTRD